MNLIVVWTLYVLVNGNWHALKGADYQSSAACEQAADQKPEGLIFRCKEHKVRERS